MFLTNDQISLLFCSDVCVNLILDHEFNKRSEHKFMNEVTEQVSSNGLSEAVINVRIIYDYLKALFNIKVELNEIEIKRKSK